MPFSYTLRTDSHDATALHALLQQALWANHLPFPVFEKALKGSYLVAAYDADNKPVGMARLVTDYAVFAYLCDVVVDEAHRGQGISKAIMAYIMAYIMDQDFVQHLRRFSLITDGAAGLYAQYGFAPMDRPHRVMEIFRNDYGA